MSVLQWKRFMFFDHEVVRSPETKEPYTKLKDINITAATSGGGFLVFGDTQGMIHSLDKSFTLFTLRAYSHSVSFVWHDKRLNLLLTVGYDEDSSVAMLRAWRQEGIQEKVLRCVRTVKIQTGSRSAGQATTMAITDMPYRIAIGWDDGTVVLLTGDLLKDRIISQRTVHEDKYPITGLGFKVTATQGCILFVVTATSVFICKVETKASQGELLDEQGANLQCAVINDEGDMLLGRNECVYYYEETGRGPCYVFDGEKRYLHWMGHYLLIVSTAKMIPRTTSNSMFTDTVIVYDMTNRCVAFTGAMPHITKVISEWGCAFLLTSDNELYQLSEKDTQSKLDLLFRKHLYSLAISLAQGAHCDSRQVGQIYSRYGDHLYSKGDYDGAIQQYVHTIGQLEPSYVIRKFLDAQRIHNLTSYLQAMHACDQATNVVTPDHTTLLLNCYLKLKDTKKLDEFINASTEARFDIETAIRGCRAAGYYQHSLDMAKEHGKHGWYLKIQMDDMADYQSALSYLSTLPYNEAGTYLKKYGTALVQALPGPTTTLLINICTHQGPANNHATPSQPIERVCGSYSSNLSAIIEQSANKPNGLATVERAEGGRVQPGQFIHIYVKHTAWLLVFLEAVVKQRPGLPPVIYNTLLELYLRTDVACVVSSVPGEGPAILSPPSDDLCKLRSEKALELLQNSEAHYDLDHAMVLVQLYDHMAGVLYLFEKAKLYSNIVQYCMSKKDYAQVIAKCQKYGQQDPTIWIMVLLLFSSSEHNCRKELAEVLVHIERKNLLPPLLVVETLSKNSSVTLTVVRDYLVRCLKAATLDISEDERLIEHYRNETAKIRLKIETLRETPKLIQTSQCTACSRPLELPTIHYMCGHSYHIVCLGDDKDCPMCQPDACKVTEMLRSQERTATDHEKFFKQ
eukprot:Ihof_evm7s20 gene=Ihof_evmTU7s20